VEQFTYCDALARQMGILPTLAKVRSLRTWLKIMFTPASTTHYVDQYFDGGSIDRQKIYMPGILVAFLSLVRLFEFPFRALHSRRNV